MRWVKVVKWRAFSFSKTQKRKRKKKRKPTNQKEKHLNKQYVHVWSSIISTCPPCFPLFHPPQMAKNPGLFFYKHHYFPRYKSRVDHALIGWVRTSPSSFFHSNQGLLSIKEHACVPPNHGAVVGFINANPISHVLSLSGSNQSNRH